MQCNKKNLPIINDFQGSVALGEALCEIKSLKALYLESNQIGDEGIKEIAQGLGQCTKLEFLDVSQNDIGESYIERARQILFISSLI